MREELLKLIESSDFNGYEKTVDAILALISEKMPKPLNGMEEFDRFKEYDHGQLWVGVRK